MELEKCRCGCSINWVEGTLDIIRKKQDGFLWILHGPKAWGLMELGPPWGNRRWARKWVSYVSRFMLNCLHSCEELFHSVCHQTSFEEKTCFVDWRILRIKQCLTSNKTKVKFENLLPCYVIYGRLHKNMPRQKMSLCQYSSVFVHDVPQKCNMWTDRAPNLDILCLALVLNSFVAKRTIISCVTLLKNMPLGLLHLPGSRFW